MSQPALRPSGASVWVKCPGAPILWQSAPPDDSDVAREGTAAHWVAEQILTGKMTGDELIDRQAPNGVYIDGGMVDHVGLYTGFVQRCVGWPHIEEQITIDTVQPGMTGTPDAYGTHSADPWCVRIVDLKYGWRVVDPFENWQLIAYAAGLPTAHGSRTTHVELVIIQPRASHPDGPIRTWRVSVEELARDYWPRLQRAALGGDCVTGNHCMNCSGAMSCEALRTATASATQYAATPLVEVYTGEQLATELAMLEFARAAIDARADAINDIAMERVAAQSGSVPGWDIARTRGTQRWNAGTDLTRYESLTGLKLHKDVPLTPNQALDAGLPERVVSANTTRGIGKPKLVKFNSTKLMRQRKFST